MTEKWSLSMLTMTANRVHLQALMDMSLQIVQTKKIVHFLNLIEFQVPSPMLLWPLTTPKNRKILQFPILHPQNFHNKANNRTNLEYGLLWTQQLQIKGPVPPTSLPVLPRDLVLYKGLHTSARILNRPLGTLVHLVTLVW